MYKRFSEHYAIDPALSDWGGEAYRAIYSPSFVEGFMADLGLSPDKYEDVYKQILSAAYQYENDKRTVLERQRTPIQERKLQATLGKKLADAIEVYSKLNDFDFHRMHAAALKYDPTLPSQFAYPNVASLARLAEIAIKASLYEKPVVPHFAPRHPHYVWVMSVAPIFQWADLPLSTNDWNIKKVSHSTTLLHKLMLPLEPRITTAKISNAVKSFSKSSGRSKGWRKTTKERNKTA